MARIPYGILPCGCEALGRNLKDRQDLRISQKHMDINSLVVNAFLRVSSSGNAQPIMAWLQTNSRLFLYGALVSKPASWRRRKVGVPQSHKARANMRYYEHSLFLFKERWRLAGNSLKFYSPFEVSAAGGLSVRCSILNHIIKIPCLLDGIRLESH